MTPEEQDSSDPDSTPSRARLCSSSRASDFTTDDDDVTYNEQTSLSALTSFDVYFLHASRPSRTSSNVFSHLVQPLSADEYAASLSRTFYPDPFPSSSASDALSAQAAGQAQPPEAAYHHAHAHFLPRYLLELAE